MNQFLNVLASRPFGPRLGVNYVAIECNFPLNHSKDRLETVEKLDNEDDKQCQITVEKIRYNIHDTS